MSNVNFTVLTPETLAACSRGARRGFTRSGTGVGRSRCSGHLQIKPAQQHHGARICVQYV